MGRDGYKRPGRGAAGHREGTRCEGCGGQQSSFPPPSSEPDRDSPIADFTTLPLTVALFLRGSGAAFLRLAAPAALGPSRPCWSPGGAFLRPAGERGTGLLKPYAGNNPLPAPTAPSPRGPTRRLQQLQAPPQQGGRHNRAHPPRPPAAANFRLLATLPAARDATSASAGPRFRRRARPGAHAQRELRPGLGGKDCGAMLWRHVVWRASRTRPGLRSPTAGASGYLLVALDCRPSLPLLQGVVRQLARRPSVLHLHGATAMGTGL